jgi:energy-coupling factor transporter ATP-binding protein EcfA2
MTRQESDPPIVKFAVYGLHGDRDIVIPTDHRCKILIAENGRGKTIVLKSLYAMLSCQFSRLNSLEFEKIVLSFPDDEIVLYKKQLPKPVESGENSFIKEIREKLSGKVEHLIKLAELLPMEKLKEHLLLQFSAEKLDIPDSLLAEQLKNAVSHLKEDENLIAIREKIADNFKAEILYLPTYRRIEEDLYQLGYIPIEIGLSDDLIQSGMSDVEERIEQINAGIRHTLFGWFNRLDKKIWERLIKEAKAEDIEIENFETLKIVMDRIRDYVSEKGKDNVLRLFDPNQRDVADDFLSDILQAYQEQKEKNETISQFITACNRYLIDKQISYNRNQGSIEVIQVKKNRSLDLKSLSSGEKQIISIFSKLYLEIKKPCVILIDEPELSISMEWQRTLLPDILNSPKCLFLMAATHSPFIFDNDLIRYTVALDEYARERR